MCFQKRKFFVLKTVFSYRTYPCVRESARAQDVGKDESHSHPYHVDI